MPALVMAAMQGIFHFIYRSFGERIRVQGRPLLEIETLGARSGARRVTILGWFPDSPESDDSWIVVASNAGASRHPNWFLNLARNPDHAWVQIGKRRIGVTPETLNGADRDQAWQRIVTLAPGYAGYREKTDRLIPIVRLTRRSKEA
jgi:deazaflavin-dependent oxidoreductase (nitroreductase family)